MSRHVDAVMDVTSAHCRNESALADLRQCARNVTDAVMQLLDSVKASNEHVVVNKPDSLSKQDASIERIFSAADVLFRADAQVCVLKVFYLVFRYSMFLLLK